MTTLGLISLLTLLLQTPPVTVLREANAPELDAYGFDDPLPAGMVLQAPAIATHTPLEPGQALVVPRLRASEAGLLGPVAIGGVGTAARGARVNHSREGWTHEQALF